MDTDSDEKCSEGIEQSKAPAVVEIGDVGQTLGDQSLTKCSTTALNSVAERTTSTISPKTAPPPVQKSLTETRQTSVTVLNNNNNNKKSVINALTTVLT